jgi:hypothetical protein
MSSTHEPPQLLEPTNLLEPLDLEHQDDAFAGRSARGESGAPGTQRRFTRETPRPARPSVPARRSPMKSALVAAGALACFGAGTLFSHVDMLTLSDLVSSPPVASANRPPAPLEDVANKSDESNQTEGKSAHSGSNQLKPDAASNAAATPQPAPAPTTTPAEQNGSAIAQGGQEVPAAQPSGKDAIAGCTGSCNQQACPPEDANCLEGGAPSPAKALTNADGSAATPAEAARSARRAARAQSAETQEADSGASSRAESDRAATRASSRDEERAQSSRHSKRAAQRETADEATGVKRKVATGGGSGRKQNANRGSGRRDVASDDGTRFANSSGQWQSRPADQGANGWGDWTGNDMPPVRSSRRAANVDQGINWRGERGGESRWQDRDWDRSSSRRRERSDEYGRNDDRRFRGGRDDFLMGRAERSEGSGMVFPPGRYRW